MPAAAHGGWTPERSVAGKRNPWSIIAVISIATFMVVLDTSIANVALAHIAGSLSASYDEAAWVITSFLVANAIVIPISGWLADVFGRKPYYMFSVALFTLSSLACGLSVSLPMLIVARILQGIGGGGLAPVEQSMMVDTFPPAKRGAAFAAYGVVVIVGPIFGPTLGGWITDSYSWHWVFLINVPIGVLSLVLVTLFVEEPEALKRQSRKLRRRGLRVDYVGFLLAALFLGCLEITLDRGQRDDWFSSGVICTTAAISALSFLAFIPWELLQNEPIINIKLFKNGNFIISNVFMLLMGVIVFGTTQFIPQLLQEVLGYTATNAGLALTAGGVATLLMMPLAGFLSGRVDARILIGFALGMQAIALWNMSGLDTGMSFRDAAVARMIQSVALPFLFVTITNIAYVGISQRQNNQASALMNVSRNLGGTFGISLVQTMLARQSQVHQAQYVETLNPLNYNYTAGISRLARELMANGLSQADATRAATAQLYRGLARQTQMLSYIDVFHVLMWVVIAVLPLVLLLKKPEKQKGGEGAGMKRALLMTLLLVGCTAGPDYKKPDLPVPATFSAPSQVQAPLSLPVAESVDLTEWWKQFHDTELETLITRALAQNPDQLTAESRVREAREQEVIAGAKGLPQVNAIGNAAHLHSGSNPLQGLAGGQQGGASPGSASSGSHGTDLSIFSAGFDATWEIDLAGGVRRSVEAAEAGTEAARWQMRDGEVTLTAEIAADYVSLRSDQARMAILDAEAKSQQDTLDLIAARAKAGFVTELDVNQQRQLLASTQAQRPPLVADMMAMRHAIAVLMGEQPGALDAELETTVPVPPIPPRLPVGLPSDLLRARPDIRMAERKLAQATADIGVATADLYPKFDLIGALTASSSSFPGLFNSSSLGQIGAGSITWPIFHGGQIHANIHAKEEEEKQAYYAYQKAVLGGVQNAEDALARYETEQQRFVALQQGEKTAEVSTGLALQQYRAGLVMYTSVLQAQTTRLTAQDNLVQSRAALTADLVSLYKALGGGWKDTNKGEISQRDINPLFEQ